MPDYTPLVSIITVSMNSAKTIKATMESVLNQTYPNIEYYVIDGASTDGTVLIIKSFEDRFGKRLRWKSEKDNGIYFAMNEGLSMVQGDIVGIINSDDWYEPDAVETAVKEFENHPAADVVYGILRYIKDEKEYRISREHHDFLSDNMIPHPTCFIKKSVYEKYGVFDTAYRSAADYDFMLRIWTNNAVFHNFDKIIANFRVGGMSFTIASIKESNDIKLAYGFIDRKKHRFEKLKIFFKRLFEYLNL